MVTRAEHRRQSLLRLGEAAISLFEELGPSATIDQVAERAGVSRRTVFRWVESKEQLAFVHPILWLDVFAQALDQARADDPDVALDVRLVLAAEAIGEHVDADPDPPRRAFLVAAIYPDLLRGYNSVFQMWVERLTAEVLSATPQPDADDHFRSRVLGSSLMGMVDAATRMWLLDPAMTYTAAMERGWSLIAPLFDDMRALAKVPDADKSGAHAV